MKFFIIVLLALAALQPAFAVNLDNRHLPFHIRTVKDATGSTTCTLDARQPAAALSGTFELSVLDSNYSLFVPGTNEAEVVINGSAIQMDPIQQRDGVILMLPADKLTTGTNSFELTRRPHVASVQTWQGTALFSINDFEAFHPGIAFREINVDALAELKNSQPATANQLRWDALHYDLFIEPDMAAPFQATSGLRSRITSASLTMTAKNISANPLAQVELNFALNDDANGGASPSGIAVSRVDSGPGTASLFHSNANDLITINLPSSVQTGAEFKVRVTYSGYPDTFWTEAYNQIAQAYTGRLHGSGSTTPDVPVVYTASQPFGGRRWFPSKDIPEDKASSTTMRVALPAGVGYKGEANGLLKETVAGPLPGQETFVWENKHPISTYLVAFYASNYVYSTATYKALDNVTQMPVSHALYPGESLAGATGTVTVLNTFRQLFGEYPFLDQRYATATWGINFGIENQTISGMPPGNTGGVGNGLTRRNIHELSHMWWGDSVTYKTFDELWLGEGFATFSEALWEEFKPGGNRAAYHSTMSGFRNSALSDSNVPLVGEDGERILNNNVYYRRGAWVIHMLRGILGDEDFFRALKQYQQIHRHSVTQSDDLRIVMENVSGKNLTNFFQQWLYRNNATSAPTFPRFGYVGSISSFAGFFLVNITTRQTQGGSIPFDMPLQYRVSDGTNSHIISVPSNAFSRTVSVITGTTRPLTIELDPDVWVLKETNSLSIRTVGLSPAVAGSFYSTALLSGGGSGTYASSTLPPGMTLTTGGTLSGTPTTAGTHSITVTRGGFLSTTYQLQVAPDPNRASVDSFHLFE